MSLKWNPPIVHSITARFISSADYSTDVHEGQERDDGTRMPARPFMMSAVPVVDPELRTAEHYQQTNDVEQAFAAMAEDVLTEIKNQIQSPIWEWDRPTVRANGKVVDSPRDIVDTGELLESQSLEFDADA